MKIPCVILTISAILISAVGLRLDTQPPQPLYEAEAYRNNLNDTQTKFENQLNILNQQINDINKVIQDASKSSSTKVTAVSEKMADERNSLYDIQQFLKVPYRLKVCECRELTNAQKDALQAKIQEVNNNIATLQTDISECPVEKCPSYVYLQEGIKNMKAYLSSAEDILHSDCCHKKYQFQEEKATGIVDLSNTLYKDNLKADGWYYGSINEQDYKLQMFELTTKYNVSTCPLNRPFSNLQLNKCTTCKQPGAVFNLGVRSCFYCGKLAYLNTTSSLCETCPPQHFYNHTAKQCQGCAAQQFLNTTSEECEACPKGKFFDSSIGECSSCPANTQYNRTAKICRPCNETAGEYYSEKKLKCFSCLDGYIFNKDTRKCELCPGNALFDRLAGSCIPCQTGYNVNLYTMKCELCPADTYYNLTMKKCVKCPKGSWFDSVEQRCVSQSEITPTECPSDYPYYNEYLDRCQQCGVSEQYDFQKKKCIPSNLIGLCPSDRPFYDISLKACIACPQGTSYNPYQYTCDKVTSHHRHELNI